ncbi:hypothetical protein [Conchiformibius kuhniae]|uniref:hypothetical protein n=1 Tax=Conchiformibius kuhniae TaxID=211502 RepID=UPI000402C04B|nr:hypothetical protein [Conchiformibius kuhniae]
MLFPLKSKKSKNGHFNRLRTGVFHAFAVRDDAGARQGVPSARESRHYTAIGGGLR